MATVLPPPPPTSKKSTVRARVLVSTSFSPPFIPRTLLLIVITFLSHSSASPPSKIPYVDHCNSTVPESTPTSLFIGSSPTSFQLSKGFLSGGSHLLDPEPNYSLSIHKTFDFSANRLHQTETPDIIQVDGILGLYSIESHAVLQKSSGGESLDRRKKRGATFELSGFWSKTTGKLCMVGRGLIHAEEGTSLDLSIVFKLNYPEKSNIFTSIVNGTVESLDEAHGPNHFDRIFLLAYAQKNYEYTLIPRVKESCSQRKFEGKSLAFESSSSCYAFQHFLGGFFRLDYKNGCSVQNYGPFVPGFCPSFMSLNLIQCSENGSLHFYVGFSNVNRYSYNRLLAPETSLVAEGFWDQSGNRLCFMACHRFNTEMNSLSNVSAGDCPIGFSLWFPAVMSIKDHNVIVGRIWSNRKENDADYFSMVSFRSVTNEFNILHGLKYNYTELDTVTKLCAQNNCAKLGKRRYPNGSSFNEMTFDIHLTNSKGENASGHAIPISLGETYYGDSDLQGYFDGIDYEDADSFKGDTTLEIPKQAAEETNKAFWNISYKMSYTFQSASLAVNEPTEIYAEGIYNAETGTLCMVGCRDLSPLDAAKRGMGVHSDSILDCEILVNIQIPSLNPEDGEHYNNSTIQSTRKRSDPLFFDHLEVSPYRISRLSKAQAAREIWRMNIEIIMVIVSHALSCIFLVVQFYRVNPSISITMLIVLTLRLMIPLLVNFEALFVMNHSQQNLVLLGASWIEVQEVILRIMTMVSFLLHLRLLEEAWYSRSAEDGKKGLWVAERRALKVCLPLYFAGGLIVWIVQLRSHETHASELFITSRRRFSRWEDLMPYVGLISDGFLLPQIILNIFWRTKEKALTPFFYVGTTLVCALPHLYDAYRALHYAPYLDWSHFYASGDRNLYSIAWDIIIPCEGVLFAFLIYLQQRFGGDCILPRRFRKPGGYETVLPASS